MEERLTLKDGIIDGLPVFTGYFTTAIAFGLMSTTLSFSLFETWLTSFFVYAGSSQFLILTLMKSGAGIVSIVISVFFINSRYIFMASSLSGKLEDKRSVIGRLFAGFSTTDEVFALASFKEGKITWPYLVGLSLTSWTGWWSGSLVGATVGDFLPDVIKTAAVITVYAMFASILGGESRKSLKAIPVFFLSALINTVMILVFNLSTGFSTVIAMIAGTVFASFIYTDEEVGIND